MRATTNEQFLADFQAMSDNGATAGGGVERQAATEADGLNRQWFAGWLTARGATVHYDAVGNQFGLFEHTPGAPYVLVGSHLDSQPRAGRFDGAYGVLAGAHAWAPASTPYAPSNRPARGCESRCEPTST